MKQLERLDNILDSRYIEDFEKDKKSQFSFESSDDSRSRSSYYSSDRDSEYDRTSLSYSEDGI